jgi:hypothetical protein
MYLIIGLLLLGFDVLYIRYLVKDPIPFDEDLTGANLEGWTSALGILTASIFLFLKHFKS